MISNQASAMNSGFIQDRTHFRQKPLRWWGRRGSTQLLPIQTRFQVVRVLIERESRGQQRPDLMHKSGSHKMAGRNNCSLGEPADPSTRLGLHPEAATSSGCMPVNNLVGC